MKIYNLLILGVSLILDPIEPAALTACNEAGLEYSEGARVLQVAVNRTYSRKLDLNSVLSQKHQFNLKKCPYTANHLVLGLQAKSDSLEVPGILKNKKIEYYDALWSQDSKSKKCPEFTVGDVWEYNGLEPVCSSPLKHIFFKQVRNNPGCPTPEFVPKKLYRKVKVKC
jgi:hypothetical protein